ncbi:MAG: hypothetical protein WC491_00825 [Candidatus Omnitrophota bacterium]
MELNKGGKIPVILAILFLVLQYAYADPSAEPQPEGFPKTEDKVLPYDLTVNASYEPKAEYARVTISGDAVFPNGSVLNIFINRRGSVITFGTTSVFDNKFSMDFKVSKKRFFPSIYSVSVLFMPEKQAPDIARLLSGNFALGSRPRKAESSCQLYAGSFKEIVGAEVEAKCEICASLAKLEAMQRELSEKYSEAEKKFNAKEWDKWSNTWSLYMRGVQMKRDSRNSFFPKAEDGVAVAANSLLKLLQLCSLELKDPVFFNKMKKDPKVRVKPEEFMKLLDEHTFGELLSSIRADASMPRIKN